MEEDYVGMIKLFAGKTAPRNWAFCDGSSLKVADNTCLFAIIGSLYGGDGVVNFNLPNLCGNVCIGAGQGTGLSNYNAGEVGGQSAVILTMDELPSHSHGFWVSSASASQTAASIGTSLAAMSALSGRSKVPVNAYVDQVPGVALSPGSISGSGGNQSHNNVQPYLGVNFIICVNGMLPNPQ